MEARIIQKPVMTLVGLAINVTLKDVQESKITHTLAYTFMDRRAEIVMCSNNKEFFGISTDPEDYNPDTDVFEYFIGVEVSSMEHIPNGMVYRKIPTNTYVNFTFKGPAENAGSVHGYLYSTWLMQNEYELCDRYNIEIYGEGFKRPESEDSITDICFPIREPKFLLKN
jgi:AraC family transcriptional regulator